MWTEAIVVLPVRTGGTWQTSQDPTFPLGINVHVTFFHSLEPVASSGDAGRLFSDGTSLEPLPGHMICILRFFVVFRSLSMHLLGHCLTLGYRRFLTHPLQFIHSFVRWTTINKHADIVFPLPFLWGREALHTRCYIWSIEIFYSAEFNKLWWTSRQKFVCNWNLLIISNINVVFD
jgi:hypothetical protein